MPKIIDSLRENILLEAQKQVLTQGYSQTTIRSVAGACGIAVGTIYNYFPSKNVMIASFMLADWQDALERMRSGCLAQQSPAGVLEAIYGGLRAYRAKFAPLFSDSDAEKNAGSVFKQRHRQLRAQLAELVRPVCGGCDNSEFTALFIAEALLSWTDDECEYKQLSDTLCRLL